MHMDTDKDGKPYLTLKGAEKLTLQRAASLLSNIARGFDGEEADRIRTLSKDVGGVYSLLAVDDEKPE